MNRFRTAAAPASDTTTAGGAATRGDVRPVAGPEPFRHAVETLESTRVRPEIRVETMRPPQKLAPYSYALSADLIATDDAETATGRLVLLHDPDGAEAWDGDLRLVAFASADLAPEMAGDPLLSEVGWSWLTGALDDRGAQYTAAGGTVTQTTSTRFGDVHGPASTTTFELRASWTPRSSDLQAHLLGFVDLIATAAGLPPEGVTVLGRR